MQRRANDIASKETNCIRFWEVCDNFVGKMNVSETIMHSRSARSSVSQTWLGSQSTRRLPASTLGHWRAGNRVQFQAVPSLVAIYSSSNYTHRSFTARAILFPRISISQQMGVEDGNYSFRSSCGSRSLLDEVARSFSKIAPPFSDLFPGAIRLLSRSVPSSPSMLTP